MKKILHCFAMFVMDRNYPLNPNRSCQTIALDCWLVFQIKVFCYHFGFLFSFFIYFGTLLVVVLFLLFIFMFCFSFLFCDTQINFKKNKNKKMIEERFKEPIESFAKKSLELLENPPVELRGEKKPEWGEEVNS